MPVSELRGWRILRKALDLRDKHDLRFVYNAEILVPEEDEPRILKRAASSSPPGRSLSRAAIRDAIARWRAVAASARCHWLRTRGLDRGVHTCGARLSPALAGTRHTVTQRIRDVKTFDEGGKFEPESNYLFGEGGAGTFSDGKLTCRGTGPDVIRVLEIFAENKGQQPGKPSILYYHRPHLGSNRLPAVVKALRRRIEERGGEVPFTRALKMCF